MHSSPFPFSISEISENQLQKPNFFNFSGVRVDCSHGAPFFHLDSVTAVWQSTFHFACGGYWIDLFSWCICLGT